MLRLCGNQQHPRRDDSFQKDEKVELSRNLRIAREFVNNFGLCIFVTFAVGNLNALCRPL